MTSEPGAAASAWSRPVRQSLDDIPPLERVVLGVRSGCVPSPLPPVRVFLGTETGQLRAERVFVWSIEQVRDPSRVYEIHLMKDLPGFDRRKWLTGFTNYRFAIPELAGRSGRAIYNDVDQVYLRDPAQLFDTPMQGRGFLAISDRDTSVMLIDCARMHEVWPLAEVRRLRRKALEARARSAGLWGPMDPGWNARDEEYRPETSLLIHFTVLQTQPWQPFPRRFVYQPNPVGPVWDALEGSADAAGFQAFTRATPSRRWRELALERRAGRELAPVRGTAAAAWEGLAELLARSGAKHLCHYSLTAPSAPLPEDLDCVPVDPLAADSEQPPPAARDGLICAELLEYLPDEDLPWLLDQMFATTEGFVYLVVDQQGVAAGRRDQHWWRTLLEGTAKRRPQVHWRLVLREGADQPWRRFGGGRCPSPTPEVWVLADDKTGHDIQSEGLAQALGWTYRVRHLRFNQWNRFNNQLLGARLRSLDRERSDPLEPPWPDLVISTGRRTAPVARWIGEQSRGASRLVQLGRKGGEPAEAFDLVVSCEHFRQPWHPRRLQTLLPLNRLDPTQLAAAAERWAGLFGGAPKPHIALVVGGSSALHRLDPATARRLGAEVGAFAESLGGRLMTITSPRTGEAAARALEQGLGPQHGLHRWRAGETDNPYLGYLALADVLVVTGESESMLSEAVASGKPLLIYPLPERRRGLRDLLAEAVVRRAHTPRLNKRGTVRPQRGMQYRSARLVDLGLVRPRRDLNLLHQALVERGLARMFGQPLPEAPAQPYQEAPQVAARVRALMGRNE